MFEIYPCPTWPMVNLTRPWTSPMGHPVYSSMELDAFCHYQSCFPLYPPVTASRVTLRVKAKLRFTKVAYS
jgi:hypothetical protein